MVNWYINLYRLFKTGYNGKFRRKNLMAKTNKGRKLFATTATAALVASAIVPVASAAEVNDINSVASYAKDAVQDLVDRGVIEGDAKGNFNPRNSVTRAEAATIFAKALDLESTGSINFSDVKSGAWYYDAIAAAVNNGVFQGQGAGKFNPSGNLTRSEAAVIYVNAFGLEGSDDLSSFKDASAVKAWAKEAIQIAVANGVLKGDDKGNLNPNANITKQDFAVMFARAEAAVVDPATNLKDALEDLKTASEKLVEKVTAENVAAAKTAVADAKEAITAVEEALKAAQEAEVVTEEEVKAIEEAITAAKAALEKAEKAVAGYEESLTTASVQTVSATNLKEVVVTFNQAVDEESATDKANYALKSGKAIQSVSLSEDKKTATVTVVGTLANNKVDAISVSNVKAGSKVINAKNVEFTTVDNKLPEVASLKSLGTKSVKLVFSEPVTALQQNNFTLDGKSYFGKVTLGANNLSVILTPYSSSALSVGDHKLTVGGVKDYAGFVSLNSTHDFTVAEDKDAPTVTEATATLEAVTLTFSEDVDVETISASKVYWKSGDSKKTASSVEVLADNKYKFNFSSANTLPTGKLDIHVESVKDYSGNEIAKDTKVAVTPEVDQTRPEVRKVTVQDARTIKVTFSKSLLESSAEEVKNYVVLNKDGKVISVQSAALDSTDSKSVIVKLYADLSDGENTLTIKNVKDATKLQNTMLDFSEKIVKADGKAPTYSANVNTTDKRVVVNFSEKMNIDTLVDYSNYLVKINGSLRTLTADMADISVIQDGAAVVITFADTINGNDVVFTSSTTPAAGKVNVNELTVLGVKDLAGNLLSEFTATTPTNVISLASSTNISTAQFDATNNPGKVAEFVDAKTIKVRFNTAIVSAATNTFTASLGGVDQAIESVQVDGTNYVTVTFKNALPTDPAALTLTVDKSKLTDISGKVGALTETITKATNLLDSVAPVIVNPAIPYTVSGEAITITYSENIEVEPLAHVNLSDTDFEIVRISDNKKLNPLTDYNVTVGTGAAANTLIITLSDTATRSAATAYTVTVKDAKYFTDDEGNAISDSVGQSQSVILTTNGAAAATVQGSITALPVVGTLTYADKAAVDAARVAYTALTADQKALVTNLTTLTAAETEITRLGNVIASVTAPTVTNATGTYATAALVSAALGTTVTVTKVDGTTAIANVAWTASADYDAAAAGTVVTYTGVVTPTAPVTQPATAISVSVTVTK